MRNEPGAQADAPSEVTRRRDDARSEAGDAAQGAEESARRMSLLRMAEGDAKGPGTPGTSEFTIYQEICESMTVGLMLMAGGGRIEMLNPAAAELLGVRAEEIVGHRFGEAFIEKEHLEEFNEAVLAAMYDGEVGHQRVANIEVEGHRKPLSVATCYLRRSQESTTSGQGVVALFTDITEVERLRTKELELVQDVQDKHKELGAAYRDLEERNRELQGLLRKVRAVRLIGATCVAAMAIGIGTYLWSESPATWFAQRDRAGAPAREARVVTLKQGYVSSSIRVSSTIKARREVTVTSPTSGQIGTVLVKLGQRVEAGETLIELDVSEAEVDLRKAQANYLNVKGRVDELADWENSVEASRARRAVTKSRIALDASREELAEQQFLFERGLTPLARLEAGRREMQSRELDLQSSEQDLKTTIAKGRERMGVAGLDLANAESALEKARSTMENATVVAPVAGVVLEMGDSSGDRKSGLASGRRVSGGEFLLSIGDMDGVTATGWVDEVEVQRVRPEHTVLITGPAFPDLKLVGTITHVSSQAFRRGGQQGLPKFEFTAVVETLSAEERAAIRLGMSARLEIVVYENGEAILVPIAAVRRRGDAGAVTVRDPDTGEDRHVEVRTGITTPYEIEILDGLEVGQQVVVP